MQIEIVSVNVGRPSVILVHDGNEIVSAIRKRRVADAELALTETGLAGDEHADTRRIKGVQVHGGRGKAVYAYPTEHFAWWARELGEAVETPAFGENVAVHGVVEETAFIGDVWRWGHALLQITEPRGPCYKLDIYRGTKMGPRMNDSGFTGWYLRVLRPAPVPTSGTIEVVARAPERVFVLDAHRAWQRRDAAELAPLLAHPTLGDDFKGMIRNVLARERR